MTLNIGTSPHGQGHDTVWSQIAADELGVHPDDVEVLHGDTSISPLGMDTYGSRSISIGGAALVVALQKIKDKARTLAAHELEVAEDDLEFRDGAFRVQGAPDKVRTIPELAVSAWTAHDLPDGYEPDLTAIATWDPKNFTWPFGTHVCVAEVDTETGATHLLRYVAVDDCGVVMNPMIVDGQVHGGVAFGIAEALYEEILYDEARQPRDGDADPVPRALGRGDAGVRARPDRDPVADEPARRQGDRRGRDDRGPAGGGQRDRGRGLASRRDRGRASPRRPNASGKRSETRKGGAA